jgi:glutaredoxin
MYSTAWAPGGKAAKEYFSTKHIPYQEFDIEKDSDAAAKFHRLGGDQVPLIIIKGQQRVGFDPNWVNSALQG